MGGLLKFADAVTAANRAVARAVAWLTAAMVAVTFTVAVTRYALGWGSIALQESIVYMHALVFMLAAAAGLSVDGHVRVDIFYSKWSAARKAKLDRAGHLLFLLPFSVFLLVASWDYVADAWRMRETSSEPGGLPVLYLLKTVILVLGAQLALQAVAGIIHASAVARRPG